MRGAQERFLHGNGAPQEPLTGITEPQRASLLPEHMIQRIAQLTRFNEREFKAHALDAFRSRPCRAKTLQIAEDTLARS